MSIWDAFKGVPNPRPLKPKPCSCCKQVHSKKVSDETACDKKEGGSNTEGARKNGTKADQKPDSKSEDKAAKNGEAQPHSNRSEETYNADDDATITAMKLAGKSWKDILAAIGKESVSQLKNHWKLIDPDAKNKEGKEEEKKQKDAEDEAKKKEEERLAKIERAKSEGQAAKKKKAKEMAEQKEADEKTEPVNEKVKKVQLDHTHLQGREADEAQEPAKAGTGVNDMKSFANQYDKQKWKAAASKHFDLTGQRITPETARKMIEG